MQIAPMVVVSDASSIHYLIQIGEIELLPKLYGTILMPHAVVQELSARKTPTEVKDWAAAVPEWVSIAPAAQPASLPFPHLGLGEREAIALASNFHDSILLLDDLQSRVAAESLGIQVVPTIRVLSTAGALSLVDFDDALLRLRRTNFRLSRKLIETIRASRSTPKS